MEHSFPCGNTALDFVGTLKARRNDVPREALRAPASLQSWLRESGVVDGDTECGPGDVTTAIALREAIYSLVAARLFGGEYDAEQMDVLNDVARGPAAIPQLTAAGRRTEATADQALSSIAREAIAILGGTDAELLKECGRPECTQVYLDRSRGSRREWCAMETCGNKMKARAYRARKRSETTA
ncbi:CGNR zinc finger domain-containing protein [Kribbella sp. NPDC049174]|uniref:CGNR zinc finger domain-containing protein n=1 Tax=Kribbella sp. NPDC049174 TaxID=3364112 RepID=UPI003713F55E